MSGIDPAVEVQAIKEAITEHLRERYGRTLLVLRDSEAFTDLMLGAGLARERRDVRVNPHGTTTEILTVTVPPLMRVAHGEGQLGLLFQNLPGLALSHWIAASEILRSGLRASDIAITEPVAGDIIVALTA